jgi:hypothetical protein
MRFLLSIVVLLGLLFVSAAKDQPQVSDFVKQHLSSIGTDQARAAVKSRAAEGSVQFKLLNVSSGAQDGKQVLVSEGNKLVTLLKLPSTSYHGERFVSDGRKVSVSNIRPGTYSTLGAFVLSHPEILTEGLWAGTLTTGWALLSLDEKQAKLQDQGVKKVGGRELHQLRYSPAKHSDLEILLFFDPKTNRHAMTTYSLEISPHLGMSERETARQEVSRYRLEERFDDFKETDGLQLPGHWIIQFTAEVPRDRSTGETGRDANMAVVNRPEQALGQSGISQFDATETAINHNVQLDAKNFEVK